MLWALPQFGSVVSAVNRPSPAIARTRRKAPRTALSNRFSSLSSSTRSWPETNTIGAPIMSSQKIGPNSLASRVRSWIGEDESSDSILPTTGLAGGCGIGLSLFFGAILELSPLPPRRHCEERSDEAIQSLARGSGLLRSARNDGESCPCSNSYSAAPLTSAGGGA